MIPNRERLVIWVGGFIAGLAFAIIVRQLQINLS